MGYNQKLLPAAVKASNEVQVMAFNRDGYVQADQDILCPLCGMRFVVLLDPHDQLSGLDKFNNGMVKLLLSAQIAEDHLKGHSLDHFEMPVDEDYPQADC